MVQSDEGAVDNRDVHTEHCCVWHGCKYGNYNNDCTVVSGAKKQSFDCEDCQSEDEEHQELYAVIAITPEFFYERMNKLMHMDSTCFGIFGTLRQAKKVIEQNISDIWEYSNKYALVETIRLNALYGGFVRQEYWYTWEGDENGHYVPSVKPEEFKMIGSGWYACSRDGWESTKEVLRKERAEGKL